jgi:hypothetical protein
MSREPCRSKPERARRVDPSVRFSIHAEVDPGLMPRIAEIFARRGLVPTRWHSVVAERRDGITIDLVIDDVGDALALRIAAEMRAVWGVTAVLASVDVAVGAGASH